ncbi:hypothetical protein B7988_10370 [Fibrobacter sp. UWB1]|nr:hypothetical protein B7988_10370 [Fibrobacter sp. UWB1]
MFEILQWRKSGLRVGLSFCKKMFRNAVAIGLKKTIKKYYKEIVLLITIFYMGLIRDWFLT